MSARQWWAVSYLAIAITGCDADNSSSNSSTPAGALPCDGLAIDCRMAFRDTYDATYAGSATGTFTLDVDILGGIRGSGVGVANITGQVDEFGSIHFSFPDGSEFTGQFTSDKHSFSGTWTASGGKSGTFSGHSATVASGTGGNGNNTSNGGGTGGTTSSTNGNGGTTGSTPSASVVFEASETACQVMVNCGSVQASACPKAKGQTQPAFVQSCWDEELAVYQCIIGAGCAAQTQCLTASTVAEDCEMTAELGGLGTGLNPTTSASASLNEAVIGCDLCLPEAKTCFNSLDCRDFATCLDGCVTGDANCTNRCTDTYPTGDFYYFQAYNCQMWDCGA